MILVKSNQEKDNRTTFKKGKWLRQMRNGFSQ